MKPLILLVDDNEDMLEFLSSVLSLDYNIISTTDAREGLSLLEKESIQLVITDIMMPDMNGYELCNTIKKEGAYTHIPVIMLTAKNTMQSKIEGLELGADAYIEKPFSMDHLKVQISNLLSNRNKIKAYFSHSPLAHITSAGYNKEDEQFMERINEIINEQIDNVDLSVEDIASIMNTSRPTLYRKIHALSDMTPNELINMTRHKKAAEYLATGNYKIYEIIHLLGFSSQANFTRTFHKRMGLTPTEFMQSKQKERKAGS
ncbi:MAG: response regulator [Bacteroidota bacterium]